MNRVFVARTAIIVLLGMVSPAQAEIQNKVLQEMIEQAKSACLSSTSKDTATAAGVELSGFLEKLKGVAAKLGATFTSKQVQEEGAISIKDSANKIKENENIRACVEKNGIFEYIRKEGERKPIVLLVENNGISYEDNPPPGMNNRVRIREGLAGRFGQPAPVFDELGIYWGWRRPQEIIDRKPDVVVLHFSAFGEDQDGKRCDPDVDGNNRCSTDVIRMLVEIKKAAPKVSFVIYSRKPICGVEFRAALVRRTPSVRKETVLLPMGGYGSRGFTDNGAIWQVELAVKDALSSMHSYGRSPGDRGCALDLTKEEEKQIRRQYPSFKPAS